MPTSQKSSPHTEESDDDSKPSVPFMLPMFSAMTGGPSNQQMFQPTPEDFEHFFTLFCERVDPIVRILHKPAIRRLIEHIKLASKCNHRAPKISTFSAVQLYMPEKWSNPTQDDHDHDICSPVDYALLMAIAYSATCSMLDDDPRLIDWFGESLAGLRRKVTFATEVSMSRLKLYSTRDFTALQAFSLYIVSLCHRMIPTRLLMSSRPQRSWMTTHRTCGTHFGVPLRLP